MRSSKPFYEYVATAYLILLFCVFPLYMNGGYSGIGTHKFRFFAVISLGAVLLLVLTGGKEFVRKIRSERFSLTDLFVFLWMLETLLSFLFSEYKKEGLFGADGWHMGLFTLLLCGSLYFVLSRLRSYRAYVIPAGIAVSSVVFLLGILDRYTIHLIPLPARAPSFISTLGNINWFMGYYCVFSTLGIGFFLREFYKTGEGKGQVAGRILTALNVLVVFTAGFAQGSESVLLYFLALFGGLFYLVLRKILPLRSVFALFSVLCFSAQLNRLFRLILPFYNYDTSGIVYELTDGNLTLFSGIAGTAVFLLLRMRDGKSKEGSGSREKQPVWFFVAVAAGILLYAGIAFLHTKEGLFPGLPDNLFLLDPDFGNGRGEAIRTAVLAFREMPFYRKLFGAGPDCFSSYVYSVPKIAFELYEFWPSETLTNAHSEPMTILVNQGVAGLFLFYGLFFSFIKGEKKAEPSFLSVILSLTVFCGLVHNLLSFSTVLNLPFLFILAALGHCEKESILIK